MQKPLALFKLLLVVVIIDVPVSYGQIAANNHLLVLREHLAESNDLLRYQCLPHSNISEFIHIDPFQIRSISIGKWQNESQRYFVVSGLKGGIPYMSKISVNCHNNQIKIETAVFNESQYSLNKDSLVVTVDPYGRFAVGFTRYFVLLYDLFTLKHSFTNITWPSSNIFFPTAIDITSSFVYIVGSFVSGSGAQWVYAKASLYLLAINFNNSQYDVNMLDFWTSDNYVTDGLNILSVSVSVNPYGDGNHVLVGISRINTIHLFSVNYTTSIHLQSIGSKTAFPSDYRMDYGAEFAWLNLGRILVVSATRAAVASYSILFYYDMLENEQITDDTLELSVFPSKEQLYPETFKKTSLYIASALSNFSSLYGCNDDGQLLIIPPSLPGYYSVNFRSPEHNIRRKMFSFIPNSAQCPQGTYKNDVGVWPCSSCSPTTANFSNLPNESNTSISIKCPQCKNKTACPLETVETINWLPNIKQNGIYPESPETDVFDDILLYYIFQTSWNLNTPLFISLIILLIVVIIAGLIRLLKLLKRFVSIRQYLTKFIRHFDLVGEGKLWFGGLISIVLLFLSVFAANFSHSYHYRYPLEKQLCNDTTLNDFSCFHNSKFDTSLQLLSSTTEQYEQILDLLDSQLFTLNIELLNTSIHCGRITLSYGEGDDFLPFSCYTNDFILYLSTKLSLHNLNLELNLFSKHTIGAIRIGLSGPDAYLPNNYLRKLNFSQVFNRTDQVLSSNPIILLQLTKSVNITESLTSNDNTTYAGLWLPTFAYDINQLFRRLNSSETLTQTTLSLELRETAFFIRNKQEPIARRSEIIFHTILFIGVCIDLTCMVLLILKLWFRPLIIYLTHKFFGANSFLHRFLAHKKNHPESAIFLEIQRLKQQIEIMAKKIDVLMASKQHAHIPTEPDNASIINEKF